MFKSKFSKKSSDKKLSFKKIFDKNKLGINYVKKSNGNGPKVLDFLASSSY